MYGSGCGRVSFRRAFMRGGTQPTPSGTYRGRACRGGGWWDRVVVLSLGRARHRPGGAGGASKTYKKRGIAYEKLSEPPPSLARRRVDRGGSERRLASFRTAVLSNLVLSANDANLAQGGSHAAPGRGGVSSAPSRATTMWTVQGVEWISLRKETGDLGQGGGGGNSGRFAGPRCRVDFS